MLVLAYCVRFLAVAHGTLEAGLERISPNLDAAARTLGESALSALRRVHLPLLVPALATAGLLVFVDAMKELPATLLLRPFNFETLSTHWRRWSRSKPRASVLSPSCSPGWCRFSCCTRPLPTDGWAAEPRPRASRLDEALSGLNLSRKRGKAGVCRWM
jgi:hypothetical protein